MTDDGGNPLLAQDKGPDDPVEVAVDIEPMLIRLYRWIRKKVREERGAA